MVTLAAAWRQRAWQHQWQQGRVRRCGGIGGKNEEESVVAARRRRAWQRRWRGGGWCGGGSGGEKEK